MIEVTGLHFRHGRNGASSDVLTDVGFRVQPGELMAILGPNGSGKSTLFQCVLGLWKFQRGEVLLGGRSIRGMNRGEIATRIAVVPQDHEPPFPYQVFDLVLMGRAAHVGVFSTPSRRDREVAHAAMDRMEIADLAERPYTRISGGERQLALIARCLAQEAPVMLLDEPTAHLDFRNQAVVLSKVRSIVKEQGLTALVNLHDPNLALLFADRVLLLKGGRVAGLGRPKDVITRENLLDVYGLDVCFLSGEGVEMVCPRLA